MATTADRTTVATRRPEGTIHRLWRKHRWDYFFIAPSLILFGIFIGYPLLQSILLAFQRYGLRSTEWVGLENFQDIFRSRLFPMALQHTVIYAAVVVVVWILYSLLIAGLLQSLSFRFQSFFRGAFYLPYVTSVVILAFVWVWIFNPEYGVLNYFLSLFGIGPIGWLINPNIALWSIILSTIAIPPGTGVVIYSAAIAAIPRDLYEAADVEGASWFQKWVSITIPLLKPTTLYLSVIYTIAAFQVFERVYIMTGGGPVNSTTTLVQMIYATAFSDFNFGRAAALALILFAFIAALSYAQFRWLSTDVEY